MIHEFYITNREREVLKRIRLGFTVKEIANHLLLSTHTINSHRKNLAEKLSARNSVDSLFEVCNLKLISHTGISQINIGSKLQTSNSGVAPCHTKCLHLISLHLGAFRV